MDDSFPRGESETSPIDLMLDILSDPARRRTVRFCVSASDQVLEFENLVDYLAGENGLTDDDRNREDIAIDLHHRHLPKLAEAKVIEFDPTTGKIRYLGGELMERWIRQIDSDLSE